MHTSCQFGPWAPNLDEAERRARFRSLRAIARILAGPRANRMNDLLRRAENDNDALVPAADELDRLAPLERRKVLASYAGLTRPQPRPTLTGTTRPNAPRHVPCLSNPSRHPPSLRIAY